VPRSRPTRKWYDWLRDMFDESHSDEVSGYVGFRTHRREAHISTIAIHPRWRGKGLGELLLLATMEKALALGTDRVTLEVRPSNGAAQNLYHKYGFHTNGVRKGYYSDGEDAVLMAVDIGSNGYRPRLRELRIALDGRLLDARIHVGQ
jgi:ribosomal-protein-alanine N-acetyltransferase